MTNDILEEAKQFALKNGASKLIKQLMLKSNYSAQDLAGILGINYQSFRTKLHRDRFTFQEVQMISCILKSEIMAQMGNERFVFRDDAVVVIPDHKNVY